MRPTGVSPRANGRPGRIRVLHLNDGPGIPSHERERGLESGYSTATEETDFGLAIVDRIADSHGWSLTVAESDAGGARIELRGVEIRR